MGLSLLAQTAGRARILSFSPALMQGEYVWKSGRPRELPALDNLYIPLDGITWGLVLASASLLAAMLTIAGSRFKGNCSNKN